MKVHPRKLMAWQSEHPICPSQTWIESSPVRIEVQIKNIKKHYLVGGFNPFEKY